MLAIIVTYMEHNSINVYVFWPYHMYVYATHGNDGMVGRASTSRYAAVGNLENSIFKLLRNKYLHVPSRAQAFCVAS